MFRVFLLILCVSTAACSTLSLSSLWALRNADFTTIDAEGARLALGFSETVILHQVALEITATADGDSEAIMTDLKISKGPGDLAEVNFPSRFASRYVVSLAAEDVGQMIAVQKFAADSRAAGLEGDLNISLNVDADFEQDGTCEEQISDLQIWAAVQLDREQGYIIVSKGSILSRLINQGSASLCSSEGKEQN